MKTLCLLRHAHSEPAASHDMDDHDRVLSARGQLEAKNVGAFMKEHGIKPEAMLCSSSARTTETAYLAFAEVFKDGMDAMRNRITRNVYLAPPEILMDMVREADDDVSRLIIVGHNPGLADLSEKLAQGGGEVIGKFPPSALAVFACDVDKWKDFSPKKAKLKTLFVP